MIRDDAPYGHDELREWCLINPGAAADLITQYRDADEARTQRDMLDTMFGDDA